MALKVILTKGTCVSVLDRCNYIVGVRTALRLSLWLRIENIANIKITVMGNKSRFSKRDQAFPSPTIPHIE